MLEPIENHLRPGEVLDTAADLVVRGWPLTVDGIMRIADATRNRFSRGDEPLIAVSADVTIHGWDLDALLAGPRLRTRSRYASAPVAAVQAAGFELSAHSSHLTTAWLFRPTLTKWSSDSSRCSASRSTTRTS